MCVSVFVASFLLYYVVLFLVANSFGINKCLIAINAPEHLDCAYAMPELELEHGKPIENVKSCGLASATRSVDGQPSLWPFCWPKSALTIKLFMPLAVANERLSVLNAAIHAAR